MCTKWAVFAMPHCTLPGEIRWNGEVQRRLLTYLFVLLRFCRMHCRLRPASWVAQHNRHPMQRRNQHPRRTSIHVPFPSDCGQPELHPTFGFCRATYGIARIGVDAAGHACQQQRRRQQQRPWRQRRPDCGRSHVLRRDVRHGRPVECVSRAHWLHGLQRLLRKRTPSRAVVG